VKLEATDLDGVFQIHPIVRPDNRGYFVKTFESSSFAEAGLQTNFPEHFFSQSNRNVIRGMHFQMPPSAQDKVVFCVAGEVLDVVVDMRTDSPTYGQNCSFRLTSEDWTALYIPVGFAHGFAATSDSAVMAYLVSTEYNQPTDAGIRWDSIGFDWPVSDPIMSDRDKDLPPFAGFESPFRLGTK
jgi:dTDP-4-dehydrorhamnose 3,5-epimerase